MIGDRAAPAIYIIHFISESRCGDPNMATTSKQLTAHVLKSGCILLDIYLAN